MSSLVNNHSPFIRLLMYSIFSKHLLSVVLGAGSKEKTAEPPALQAKWEKEAAAQRESQGWRQPSVLGATVHLQGPEIIHISQPAPSPSHATLCSARALAWNHLSLTSAKPPPSPQES